MEILPNKQIIFPETNLAVSDNTIVVGYDEDVTSYDITATVESNLTRKTIDSMEQHLKTNTL